MTLCFDERNGRFHISRRQQMAQRRFGKAMGGQPHAGAAMQRGNLFLAPFLSQPPLQQLPKQMMIAVPRPFFIQRNQEEIGACQAASAMIPRARQQQLHTMNRKIAPERPFSTKNP